MKTASLAESEAFNAVVIILPSLFLTLTCIYERVAKKGKTGEETSGRTSGPYSNKSQPRKTKQGH